LPQKLQLLLDDFETLLGFTIHRVFDWAGLGGEWLSDAERRTTREHRAEHEPSGGADRILAALPAGNAGLTGEAATAMQVSHNLGRFATREAEAIEEQQQGPL